MKNTKELFIRLYIGTLYSNFIVPLRGSNYIQLLYGDLQRRLGFFFEQTRWLVWQEYGNEIGQNLAKLGRSWTIFEADGLDQNLTEIWLSLDKQLTTKTLPENGMVEAKMLGQKLVKTWSVLEVNQTIQNLYRNWTEILPQSYSSITPKMSSGGIKCHQNFIGLSSKNDHQTTTKTPPELAVRCGRKIGSIRVKSDQKIGANQCRLVQSSSRVSAGFEAKIGANRGESGQILTGAGTKMRSNECGCGQKIGAENEGNMRPNATKCDQKTRGQPTIA